ncbi:MAG: O-antigen ligase family protein, partial [Pseudomonadales bacterium]|nr:O-antigen ligase family protein [Pseudomonadales bacterium]
MTSGDVVSEYIINQNKWLIPAYLVFVGARTPERRKLALAAICTTYLLIALIVLRRIPISSVSSGMELTQRGLKVLEQAFGWSRVNTATVLAGGAWAIYLSTNFLTNGRFKWLPLGLFGLSSISLALTGGRMGYGAWAAIGGIFSAWRWRKGILLLPLAMALVLAFVPSVQQRLLQGISTNSGDTEIKDASELTSGRTDAWPVAIDRISASPWFGYGRHAMVRTGASAEVARREGLKEGERGFPHPHNMYLRIMMDSGLIGTVPILLMYLIILKRSASICRYKKGEAASIGMATLSLVLALLIAGLGSQDVFPVQGTIAMWASVALALRVHRDMVLGVYQAPELMTEPAEETVQAKTANAANEPEPLWEKARGDAARSRYL